MSAALTFLGLAAKAGHLTIGEESCGIDARAKKAALLCTASDASQNSVTRAKNYASAAGVPSLELPFTKAELGRMVGRGMPGMLAITDIGMALSFAEKLSDEFEGKYTDIVEPLKQRYEKVQLRKMERKRHLDNVRRGKTKK